MSTRTFEPSDWLTEQARLSATRLAGMDPTLLSPVGRELRDYARDMLANEAPVDYDAMDAADAARAAVDAPLAEVIDLAAYRKSRR